MRITIKKTKTDDFMGGRTQVMKITITDASEVDLFEILGGAQMYTGRRLAGPVGPSPVDPGAVGVSAAMQAAARDVFLSPERVEALRETLAEVYRAMEHARRAGR